MNILYAYKASNQITDMRAGFWYLTASHGRRLKRSFESKSHLFVKLSSVIIWQQRIHGGCHQNLLTLLYMLSKYDVENRGLWLYYYKNVPSSLPLTSYSEPAHIQRQIPKPNLH